MSEREEFSLIKRKAREGTDAGWKGALFLFSSQKLRKREVGNDQVGTLSSTRHRSGSPRNMPQPASCPGGGRKTRPGPARRENTASSSRGVGVSDRGTITLAIPGSPSTPTSPQARYFRHARPNRLQHCVWPHHGPRTGFPFQSWGRPWVGD